MKVFISENAEETERFAAQLSSGFTGGEVIAFRGGLGAGKTCFTRGLAKGLGYSGSVTSPTFALINEYIGGRLPLYHFDMYRIETWDELYSTGFFEYSDMNGVIACEWSENIENALPDNVLYVDISVLGKEKRKITVMKKGEDNNENSCC